jgi:hypothetical protein
MGLQRCGGTSKIPFTNPKAWRWINALGHEEGRPLVATAAERMAATTERWRRGEVQVIVVLSERDLAKIAQRGYADAAFTDATLRANAVAAFLSDALLDMPR